MRATDLKHFGPVNKPAQEFTPGPWHIDPDASGLDGWPIRAKQGPIEVCPARANGLADAHLIAAAPELYAALKNISACFGVGYTSTNKFVEAVHDFMMEARTVLAKAEGRS